MTLIAEVVATEITDINRPEPLLSVAQMFHNSLMENFIGIDAALHDEARDIMVQTLYALTIVKMSTQPLTIFETVDHTVTELTVNMKNLLLRRLTNAQFCLNPQARRTDVPPNKGKMYEALVLPKMQILQTADPTLKFFTATQVKNALARSFLEDPNYNNHFDGDIPLPRTFTRLHAKLGQEEDRGEISNIGVRVQERCRTSLNYLINYLQGNEEERNAMHATHGMAVLVSVLSARPVDYKDATVTQSLENMLDTDHQLVAIVALINVLTHKDTYYARPVTVRNVAGCLLQETKNPFYQYYFKKSSEDRSDLRKRPAAAVVIPATPRVQANSPHRAKHARLH